MGKNRANIHDSRLVGATLEQVFAFFETQGIASIPDNLCLDKGMILSGYAGGSGKQDAALHPLTRRRDEGKIPSGAGLWDELLHGSRVSARSAQGIAKDCAIPWPLFILPAP